MGRSPCCEKEHTNKGAWTKEEDQRLIDYIRLHGEGSWRSLPKAAGLLRCGKSCRLRWINYLRPDLKRGNFSQDEDDLIIKLHSLLGNKWSLIAARLPGRTDNEIKNYWNTHIKRKLISHGINPQTHRPLDKTATVSVKSAAEWHFKTSPENTFLLHSLKNQKHHEKSDSFKFNCIDFRSMKVTNSATTTSKEEQEPLLCGGCEPNLELSIGLLPFHSTAAPVMPTAAACRNWQFDFQRWGRV